MKKVLELLSDTKVKITVIAVLVGLFAIMMIGAIAKNRMNNQEEQKEEVTKEVELTEDLKKTIAKYINDLSTGNYCEIAAQLPYANDCIYRQDSTTVTNLSDVYRTYSLVKAIGARSENNIMVGTIVTEGKAFYNPHFVDLDVAAKEYTNLYGKEATFTPELVNNLTDINIRYDASRKKFFYLDQQDNEFVINYIDHYETKESELDVYVRVGYMSYLAYKYKLYTGKDKLNLQGDFNSREYKEGNLINESNASTFKEYKFVFTKEEGSNNLVFKQVSLNN